MSGQGSSSSRHTTLFFYGGSLIKNSFYFFFGTERVCPGYRKGKISEKESTPRTFGNTKRKKSHHHDSGEGFRSHIRRNPCTLSSTTPTLAHIRFVDINTLTWSWQASKAPHSDRGIFRALSHLRSTHWETNTGNLLREKDTTQAKKLSNLNMAERLFPRSWNLFSHTFMTFFAF